MATIDVEQFRTYEKQGFLTCRDHPEFGLLIWNYTAKCQFERVWNDITMQARGLITTPDGLIIARPFRKFFNIEEHQGPFPQEPFTVTEKLDGSLGVLFYVNNVPYIATRGSFTSAQSLKGTEILHRKYQSFPFDPEYTYLFEIVYPENAIVVDYGEREDLILLAMIHTETGAEIDIHQRNDWPFPIVKRYDGIIDINELKERVQPNQEGFVIRFASGLRLKCKFPEYVRLHRLLTRCTARSIWDLLRNNQPFDDLLERVPDEFFTWVQVTRDNLQTQYLTIERESREVFEQVRHLPTRKEQAAIVCKSPHAPIIFNMLDNKPYAETIWKRLRPEAEKPFKLDIDA